MIAATIVVLSASVAVIAIALLVWLAPAPGDPGLPVSRVYLALALFFAVTALITRSLP
jgi:hypothetical protein